MVICLERGADLHMAQLMPLPLTVSCFSKIQIGFTFLLPAHPGSPGKRAVKRVCVCVLIQYLSGDADRLPVFSARAASNFSDFSPRVFGVLLDVDVSQPLRIMACYHFTYSKRQCISLINTPSAHQPIFAT